MEKIKTAILGASGYTGADLVRLLHNHPHVDLTVLTANRHAGKKMKEVFPHLAPFNLPDLITIEDTDWDDLDLVFCALPHGTTQEVIRDLPLHLKVIDLSADFRLTDFAAYEQWYGHPHEAPHLQPEAVYGLVEHHREEIQNARLIAVPGCYPTASLLPLIPLKEEDAIDLENIIIDAKTGVTGAGRSLKEGNLYSEVSEGFRAYGIGGHRHMAELEQALGTQVSFTPHLVPMARGMFVTTYVRLANGHSAFDLRAILEEQYKDEAFVHVLEEGKIPDTRHVRGTNLCLINVFPDVRADRAIVISVIDNLVKGASGQAIQNMNVLYGFDETLGLEGLPLFP
ncbi:MAG: N-acetyl-gamma-glutamyl-phosphate reductase [Alphaproteobacteria bacterium]